MYNLSILSQAAVGPPPPAESVKNLLMNKKKLNLSVWGAQPQSPYRIITFHAAAILCFYCKWVPPLSQPPTSVLCYNGVKRLHGLPLE